MTEKRKGMYIVLEGPEGVGKSTQVERLARRLGSEGYPVRLFREPDSQSDLTARAIRTLTQDPHYPMNTRTEVLLYNAARSQSLDIIRRARDEGVICICDRNYLTTLAIQYYGRGDVPDYAAINEIIAFAVGDMQPDLTIVLDAPATTLKERAQDRGAGERFDNLDLGFLERVRAGYLWEAKQRNYPLIFATGTPDEIHEAVWQTVHGKPPHYDGHHDIEPPMPSAPPLPVSSTKPDHPAQPTAAGPAAQPPTAAATVTAATTSSEAAKAPQQPATEASQAATRPAAEATDDGPYAVKDEQGVWRMTERGRAFMDEAVTDTAGDVYAFTDKLSPMTVAAAMARLSRRGDDMRITILDEFAGKMDRDTQLLQRVITAYGDDSVQQLAGIHFVVENTTKLMTNILEWGRLGAYLEQSTRYIYFDQKDKDGHYKYYVPASLNGEVRRKYIKSMNRIFNLYSEMVRKLTDHVREHSSVPEGERDAAFNGATRAQACDAVRLVLPTATTTTIGFYMSGQALESLVMHLLSNELPEARTIGESLLKQARRVVPVLLERADKPERGGAAVAYRATTAAAVKRLADEYLPATNSELVEPVQLVDYWPKNELDLVPDMLYEPSNLDLRALQDATRTWPYDRKVEVFTAYMGERLNRRHRPGRALEKAHYSWDLICDFGIFCDLMRHRMVDDLEWQAATPRYGYEVPSLIEEAGLTDQFEACFDISLKLHSLLQEHGYGAEAQYATLLGHRMRWKVTYNARQAFHLHELRTSPQGHPGYRKLVRQMHEKLAEVHPLMAEAMIFVNQGEDAELTRLAAERYTQYKLAQLDEAAKTDASATAAIQTEGQPQSQPSTTSKRDTTDTPVA